MRGKEPKSFSFHSKKKSWGQSLKSNFKKSIFLVILKVSLLNNIKIKNKIYHKVINKASPKSSCPGLVEYFPLSFLPSEKVIRSVDPTYTNCAPLFLMRRVELPTKFSKRRGGGGLTGPHLLEGVARKEGGDFFQGEGGYNFQFFEKPI